jgi:hypothetical protein
MLALTKQQQHLAADGTAARRSVATGYETRTRSWQDRERKVRVWKWPSITKENTTENARITLALLLILLGTERQRDKIKVRGRLGFFSDRLVKNLFVSSRRNSICDVLWL